MYLHIRNRVFTTLSTKAYLTEVGLKGVLPDVANGKISGTLHL